jgi:hypothetical protein
MDVIMTWVNMLFTFIWGVCVLVFAGVDESLVSKERLIFSFVLWLYFLSNFIALKRKITKEG